MIVISEYCKESHRGLLPDSEPYWVSLSLLKERISAIKSGLSDSYLFTEGVAVHPSATIEAGAILKGDIIVSENCFIAAHAYIRGPVFLGKGVVVGPSCEVKNSIVLDTTTLAHFNFVGDSIIGHGVNLEAGVICANHYNERENKEISVRTADAICQTRVAKLGALIGDNSRIGANAVLSPGTILPANSIVGRLQLIEQNPE